MNEMNEMNEMKSRRAYANDTCILNYHRLSHTDKSICKQHTYIIDCNRIIKCLHSTLELCINALGQKHTQIIYLYLI